MDPITRKEQFLATAAGEFDGDLPIPVTREEYYLKKIAESGGGNGGGGGSVTVDKQLSETSANPVQNKVITAEIKEIKNRLAKVEIKTFADVQKLVRSGKHLELFSIGDQFEVTKGDQKLIWDILDLDKDIPVDSQYEHSMTLQLHDCYNTMQYDAKEALFAFPDGLAAGTYHFTINAQPWFAGDVGKTITFTLEQAIPAGGQLYVNNSYNATMIGATISAFASGSAATAIETVTMSEGDGGTDLGGVAIELTGENTNSIHRALLGSNNWRESAMRQWLNSDKAAGSVWTPQTKFDRPPSWVSNTAGFMNGLDKDFISSLGKVKKTTALNNITDGGTGEESEELFFLLSRSEVYGTAEKAGVDEGAVYSYYANATNAERVKTLSGSARNWWLRTPYVSYYANSVRYVNTLGALTSNYANSVYGVAPACCII